MSMLNNLSHSHVDPYRSMPGTPLSADSRSISQPNMEMAMNHLRMGLDGPEPFPGGQRFGPLSRPRSPYPGTPFPGVGMGGPIEHDYFNYESNTNLPEQVMRRNLAATLCNMQLNHRNQHGQVFPHVCADGSYPADFRHPKRLETMKILDNSQLDRIMSAYHLPLDLRPNGLDRREVVSSTRARQAKLQVLLEFLGAYRLMEHDRLKLMNRILY